VSRDRFELVDSCSGSYYKISYELEMRLEAAISFRLIFEGKISFYPMALWRRKVGLLTKRNLGR